MSRAYPYRRKPAPETLEKIQLALSARFYLVQETGPTSFVIKGDGSETKYKISIGETHRCSCNLSLEPCVHILFVLIKIYRIPPENPLVWQVSLIDSEIASILSGRIQSQRRSKPQKPTAIGPTQTAQKAQRRPIEEGDICPICQEDMCEDDALTWCKQGCGGSLHQPCMKVWASHRQSMGEEVTCPLCRTEWGPLEVEELKKKEKKKMSEVYHMGVGCGGCRTLPIRGARYKCIACADYNLCMDCFHKFIHPQHSFECKETPQAEWSIAERNRDMQIGHAEHPPPPPPPAPAPSAETRPQQQQQRRERSRQPSTATRNSSSTAHQTSSNPAAQAASNALESALLSIQASSVPGTRTSSSHIDPGPVQTATRPPPARPQRNAVATTRHNAHSEPAPPPPPSLQLNLQGHTLTNAHAPILTDRGGSARRTPPLPSRTPEPQEVHTHRASSHSTNQRQHHQEPVVTLTLSEPTTSRSMPASRRASPVEPAHLPQPPARIAPENTSVEGGSGTSSNRDFSALQYRELSPNDFDALLQLDAAVRPREALPTYAVNLIPVQTYGSLDAPLASEACMVCLLDFEIDQKIKVLPCHHPFHQECIDRWLSEERGTCPIDNKPVFPDDSTSDSGGHRSSHQHNSSTASVPPPPRSERPSSGGSTRALRPAAVTSQSTAANPVPKPRKPRPPTHPNPPPPPDPAPTPPVSLSVGSGGPPEPSHSRDTKSVRPRASSTTRSHPKPGMNTAYEPAPSDLNVLFVGLPGAATTQPTFEDAVVAPTRPKPQPVLAHRRPKEKEPTAAEEHSARRRSVSSAGSVRKGSSDIAVTSGSGRSTPLGEERRRTQEIATTQRTHVRKGSQAREQNNKDQRPSIEPPSEAPGLNLNGVRFPPLGGR